MSYDVDTIDAILSMDNIGAGNYLYKLKESGLDTTKEVVELDISLKGFPGVKRLSIDMLCKISDFYASWFIERGVKPKDPVAVFLGDGADYFILFLALTRIGAIPVLVNDGLETDIVVGYFDYVNASVVVTDEVGEYRLRSSMVSSGLKADLLNIDTINFGVDSIESIEAKLDKPYRHQPSDPVLLAHTSGTTGIPKAVKFSHESLFYGFKQQLKKQVGDRMLSALPHSHSSSIGITMSSLLRGNDLRIQTKREAHHIERAVREHAPDVFIAFSGTYVELCRSELEEAAFDSIQYWISTGDANHESHIRRLVRLGNHYIGRERHKGSLFIDNLGSSEFAFAVFVNVHTPTSNNYNRCIGRPMQWAEVAVLSEDGEELGDYEIGKLGVHSHSVTPGYWNNSFLTEKSKLGKYWLLGDLVYRNSAGIYYHVDRDQDRICYGDRELYSCQIEESIMANVQEVFDCSLVCTGEHSANPKLVLTVETDVKSDVDQLRYKINEFLQSKDIPAIDKLVVESATINAGVTGKKLKRKLRTQMETTE